MNNENPFDFIRGGFLSLFVCINALSAATQAPSIKLEQYSNSLTEVACVGRIDVNKIKIQNCFGERSAVYDVKFSPDDKMIAIVAGNGVQVSCIENGSIWPLGVSIKIDVSAKSLAFSPDGKLLLLGTWDGRVILMNLLSLKLRELYRDKSSCVTYSESTTSLVAFSFDSKLMPDGSVFGSVVSYFRSGWLKTFDLQTEVLKENHIIDSWNCFMYEMVFSHDGKLLAMGGQDGQVMLINTESLSFVELYRFNDSFSEVKALAFDATDGYLYSGSYASDMIVYDLKNKCIFSEKKNILSSSWAKAANEFTTNFSQDFTLAFQAALDSGDNSQIIKVIDVSDLSQRFEFTDKFDCLISDIVMSYDKKKIAVVSEWVDIFKIA